MREVARTGWANWYRETRQLVKYVYDTVGVPVDTYKSYHSLGLSPEKAAEQIALKGVGRPDRPDADGTEDDDAQSDDAGPDRA